MIRDITANKTCALTGMILQRCIQKRCY